MLFKAVYLGFIIVSTMPSDSTDPGLSGIFTDVAQHQAIRQIIQRHATNPMDIREFALSSLDLETARAILDLGCGFGFFTQSLKDKVSVQATIQGIDQIPAYKTVYLDHCLAAGLRGTFSGAGIKSIKQLPDASFDLILCSYSLYFFPDIIPDIARLLKPSGHAVIITHDDQHAIECMDLVRATFKEAGHASPEKLPYEDLIRGFNGTNGQKLLSPFFRSTVKKEYRSALIFKQGEFDELKSYFEFKKPYYFPGEKEVSEHLTGLILDKLKIILKSGIPFRITKDDTIFICSEPTLRR